MRKSILGLSAFALVAIATPAFAADDDGLGLTITGSATVVSDYRFRGVSQSNEDVAIQSSVTVTHTSGAYVGFWGSTNKGQGELDVIGGFSHELVPGLTGDIGVTYYLYPNRRDVGGPIAYSNAGTLSGLNAANELVEPYVSLSGTVGPVWGKVGFAWAPKQDYFQTADGRRNENTYVWGDSSIAIPNTPLKLTGHAGWTSNHYLRSVFNDGLSSSKADVIDYGVGASASYKALTLGVNFISTNVPKRYIGFSSYTSGTYRAREVYGADNTVVFSLGAAF
ncbi:MAG TPA: TorF family putative porin [Sphingobium sp.]